MANDQEQEQAPALHSGPALFDFTLPVGFELNGKLCRRGKMRRLKGVERIMIEKACAGKQEWMIFATLARSIAELEGQPVELTQTQVSEMWLADVNALGRLFGELNDPQAAQGESGAFSPTP